jgi:hypothetical protein
MKIALIAMFKNESHILKEWLDHYLREGVDTFFLINNNSTDNYKPILEPYLQSKQVILTSSKKKNAQVELYNIYLPEVKKYDWVIVVDLDEFVYARKGFTTIKDYLQTVDKNIYKIIIPWKMFGSSGFKKQPSSVIQNFVHRKKFPDTQTHTNLNERVIDIKTICRGPHIQKINNHNSIVTDAYAHESFSNNNIDKYKDVFFTLMDEPLLQTQHLHLNHYRIQSWEFYKKVKMTRGDGNVKVFNHIRTKKYFNIHDYRDIKDTELKDKKY